MLGQHRPPPDRGVQVRLALDEAGRVVAVPRPQLGVLVDDLLELQRRPPEPGRVEFRGPRGVGRVDVGEDLGLVARDAAAEEAALLVVAGVVLVFFGRGEGRAVVLVLIVVSGRRGGAGF